jgi:O-antigen/teichoic acid export membrane protein
MALNSPDKTNAHERLIVVKNAIANIARGSAASIVAVFLPPFLTRRFVAHSTERGDLRQHTRIVSSAFVLLSLLAILAAVTIWVVATFLPALFRQIHGHLIFETRMTLLLVGGSLAVGLPESVSSSTFVGLQRNEVPAFVIGISRLLSAAIVVASLGNGLVAHREEQAVLATHTQNIIGLKCQSGIK